VPRGAGGEDALTTERTDLLRELDELRQEVNDLRASRKRLAIADDDERRTIERLLHDGVQQLLVGLDASIALAVDAVRAARPAEATTLLTEIGRDVQRAVEETRTLAQRIYPMFEAGGLVPALRWAASIEGVPTRIGVPEEIALRPEIAGTVYACCLRVLERADVGTPVTITVRDEGGWVSFEILANVDPGSTWTALGDRVEALGGRLSLRSEPGPRIRLIGSLPLSG
jgi:signal transduction histidine kinase